MRVSAVMVAVVIGACVGNAQGQCVGDCGGDGQVAINELIVGVNMALGTTPVSECSSFDANVDGQVTINELILGVNNAFVPCADPRTPTEPTTPGTASPEPTTPTPTVSPQPPTPSPTEAGTTFSSMDFVAGEGVGSCGDARDAGGSVLQDLQRGLIYVGGGGSQAPPIGTQQLRARFAVTGCTGTVCTLGPTDAAAAAPLECTETGCPQGPPVTNTDPLPTCSATTWSAPAEGMVDVAAGTASVLLHATAHSWLTINRDHPCPRCVEGTCDRGARAGLACTSTNADGLTHDCLPGGADNSVDLGFLNLDVMLSTGAQSQTTPDGAFCEGQDMVRPGIPGCFGRRNCRAISATGTAAAGGFLPAGSANEVTLATLSCVPPTGNSLIDSSSDLPGPAVECVTGTITMNQ